MTIAVANSFREDLRSRLAVIQEKYGLQGLPDLSDEETYTTAANSTHEVVLIEQSSYKEFRISHDYQGQIVVGRFSGKVSEAHINLTDISGQSNGVSRLHASFKWRENSLQIVDLESRNGTYINGKRLVPKQVTDLHDNDILSFGYVNLLVKYR